MTATIMRRPSSLSTLQTFNGKTFLAMSLTLECTWTSKSYPSGPQQVASPRNSGVSNGIPHHRKECAFLVAHPCKNWPCHLRNSGVSNGIRRHLTECLSWLHVLERIGPAAFYQTNSSRCPGRLYEFKDSPFEPMSRGYYGHCLSVLSLVVFHQLLKLWEILSFMDVSVCVWSIFQRDFCLGRRVFIQCRSLLSICIPSTVNYIGAYCFKDCNPSSFTQMDQKRFESKP